MEGVGEEREGEGNKAQADPFLRIVSVEMANYFGERRHGKYTDDERCIRLARNQKEHKDESVKCCRRAEASEEGRRA